MTSNLKNAKSFNELLELKYGSPGQAKRDEFEERSRQFILAELLKEARKQAHLTQQQLADKVGTDKSYVSRLENGKIDIPLSILFKIVEQGLGRQLRFEVR